MVALADIQIPEAKPERPQMRRQRGLETGQLPAAIRSAGSAASLRKSSR